MQRWRPRQEVGRTCTETGEGGRCTFLHSGMTDEAAASLWYSQIQKPWFAPPSWVFGPVWSVLYVLIAVSFGYVFFMTIRRRWPAMIALPFAINLAANLLYTPLQFGLHNNVLALLDVLIILFTIPWAMHAVWGHARWVGYMQVPYLLWVTFATVICRRSGDSHTGKASWYVQSPEGIPPTSASNMPLL